MTDPSGSTDLLLTVTIKELPQLHVAYVRHVGPCNGIGAAFGRLMAWAEPQGFLQQPDAKVIAVYHDDPARVAPPELRSSACITVPQGTETTGEVSTMDVPGGLYALAHVEIQHDQFSQAWQVFMAQIHAHGYASDPNRACYEVYLNDPQTHPERKFIVELCEPIQKK